MVGAEDQKLGYGSDILAGAELDNVEDAHENPHDSISIAAVSLRLAAYTCTQAHPTTGQGLVRWKWYARYNSSSNIIIRVACSHRAANIQQHAHQEYESGLFTA